MTLLRGAKRRRQKFLPLYVTEGGPDFILDALKIHVSVIVYDVEFQNSLSV
jgi:hypothetical protein